MKHSKNAQSTTIAMVMALLTLLVSSVATAAETKKDNSEPTFLSPIKSPQNWYAGQVTHGRDIYFSANYIFQATKLRTQEFLVEYEQTTIYPKLRQLLDEIKQMGLKGPSLLFIEMARRLLDPKAKIDPSVSKEVTSRLESFKKDP
ncbi:MAG: hypothetical protein WB554_10885 [Desulfomonilaceae bacterium]